MKGRPAPEHIERKTIMQGRLTDLGATETRLSNGWRLTLTAAEAWAAPAQIDSAANDIPAPVPGTVAEALEQAGQYDRTAPHPLDTQDAWYLCRLTDQAPGPALLRFAGLSTLAEVYLDDTLILTSNSMFEAHDVAVTLTGNETLAICFRALGPKLLQTGPRARWRPQMMDSQGLRLIRTTALGHMPGWCPDIHAIGPWRPISVIRTVLGAPLSPGESHESGKPTTPSLRLLPTRQDPSPLAPAQNRLADTAMNGRMTPLAEETKTGINGTSVFDLSGVAVFDVSIKAGLDLSGTGILSVSFLADQRAALAQLLCGGMEQDFEIDAQGRYCAELRLPDAKPWWPRSHGEPHLYPIDLRLDGHCFSLGKTGFRRFDIDRGADGSDFAILVNGERVFCRGAVWTTTDIVRLPGEGADYRPWLALAAEAGMNMIRIGGTMAYETPEFFQACDELGLMVWQDLMLANFDYPAKDIAFLEHIETEVRQFLDGIQASPSLAVLCGGSEIYQQGAMLGLPERIWKNTLCGEFLPDLLSRLNNNAPYVANSPSGGAMPFAPNAGVTHYYGVGAYCRPLDDARRANVRFAAECLAFSHVPQQSTLDTCLSGVQPVHDPRWKARVPRDRGASWDFEDIREHYLTELYGLDPQKLRREDPGLYLEFSRAVTAQVTEATFAEWRRPQSSCNGALVWTLQDLLPGAGWGVLDSSGLPKSVWYGLKRAFRPVQVLVSDEGTNGLDVHVINEGEAPLKLDLELTCFRAGQQAVVSGRIELQLAARENRTLAATELFGAFFDTTYAFRFGPPAHDVTVARLRTHDGGKLLADAFHFPLGRAKALHTSEITAAVTEIDGHWVLQLATDRLAQSVGIDAEGFRAEDNGFHLAPGEPRQIRLIPLTGTVSGQKPTGEIRALGDRSIRRF
jgi:beta-mannosidase